MIHTSDPPTSRQSSHPEADNIVAPVSQIQPFSMSHDTLFATDSYSSVLELCLSLKIVYSVIFSSPLHSFQLVTMVANTQCKALALIEREPKIPRLKRQAWKHPAFVMTKAPRMHLKGVMDACGTPDYIPFLLGGPRL